MEHPPCRQNLFRRYKWKNLSDPEKDAVKDAIGIASTRAGVGVGVVLTTSAILLNARRGKPPLPRYIQYGGISFFSIVGAYVGFLSGGPIYARRILSVPDSQLAEDLRISTGDWQARVPETPAVELREVSGQIGSSPSTTLALAGTNASEGNEPARLTQPQPQLEEVKSKSVAYWLGLAKS